jgi:hypothetical protein
MKVKFLTWNCIRLWTKQVECSTFFSLINVLFDFDYVWQCKNRLFFVHFLLHKKVKQNINWLIVLFDFKRLGLLG